jgi:hypothetical protein
MIFLRLTALLLGLYGSLLQAETVVELYQPSNKTTAELIQTLTSVYPQEIKLSTDGQQIIIRGEYAQVNQAIELLLQLDHPRRLLQLEISHSIQSPNTKTYSTHPKGLSGLTYTITENTPFILAKEQRAQQLNAIGPHWYSVEQVASNQETLQVRVQTAKDYVYVDFSLQTLVHGQYQMISHTISGPLHTWLSISEKISPQENSTHSTTQRDSTEPLFIKITPVN